ncbi:MAG: hypothetical protein IPK10_17510 [Bacteroidetes bacterium]|nr:hypothetical protein [Bacteroidota bacterium]
MSDQMFDRRTWERTEPIEEHLLEAGDLLYIPRGIIHDAVTSDCISTHITLGVFPHTWIDIYKELISKMKNDVEFRKSPMNHLFLESESHVILKDVFENSFEKIAC